MDLAPGAGNPQTGRVSLTCDVVVVGAGVIGCSIALELARTGTAVVVVDKAGAPGQGSTSASSAIVRFNYSTYDGVALSWEAGRCWEHWADHVEGVAAPLARFRRTGLVMLDVDVAWPEHGNPRVHVTFGVTF